MLLLVLVLSLGSEDGELLKDEFEFRPIVLDLGLEFENVPIASTYIKVGLVNEE